MKPLCWNQPAPSQIRDGAIELDPASGVNGDGRADIITSPDMGGGPHVKVFDGRTGDLIRSFFPYGLGFTGGVRVAAADVNGDGRADIITSPDPGGGPHIKVYDGLTNNLIRSFFAYEKFGGGIFVAAGDVSWRGSRRDQSLWGQ